MQAGAFRLIDCDDVQALGEFMSIHRSICHASLLAVVLVPWLGTASAQDATAPWKPTKPIKLIVPYPAGGGTDVPARVIAEKLQAQLGQPVIVDNRGGANGIIGSQIAFTAVPDGLTLLVGTIDTQALNPNTYTNLTFQPNAFVPVAPIATVPMVFAGSKSGKARSLSELVDLAKKSDTNYGHYGIGSLGHLAGEVFKQQAGIANMQGIPYQGTGPGSQALMSGQIDMMLLPLTMGMSNAERFYLFGLASANHFPKANQIPTMAEVGYPIIADAWLGVFVPPKTPKPVVDALHKAITATVADPDTSKRLLELGIIPQQFPTPEAYSAWVASEQARWGKVIQGLGIKLTL